MTGKRQQNALSPVGAVAGAVAPAVKTVGLTLLGLGVVGGLGYVGWRMAKSAKSIERQSEDAAAEAALAQIEQQSASGQKGSAQAQGAAKAAAEGTDKLASVTFALEGVRSYGWTVKVQMPPTIKVPVNGQASFDAMEDTLTKIALGRPDWRVTPKLALDPVLGELVLKVDLEEHTVFGALQSLGPMRVQSAQSGNSVNLGGLLTLDKSVREGKTITFVSENTDPDLVIKFRPVTYAYR